MQIKHMVIFSLLEFTHIDKQSETANQKSESPPILASSVGGAVLILQYQWYYSDIDYYFGEQNGAWTTIFPRENSTGEWNVEEKKVRNKGCREKEVARWKSSQDEKVCNVVITAAKCKNLHCARFAPWSEWQWKGASVQNRDGLYPSLLTQFQNLIFPLIWMAMLCPWGFSKPLAPCSRYRISFFVHFLFK